MTKGLHLAYRLTCLTALLPVLVVSSTVERIIIAGTVGLSLLYQIYSRCPLRAADVAMLLGFAIATVPWLGTHLIAGVALSIFLTVPYKREYLTAIRWALPLLLYLGGALVAEAFITIDNSPLTAELLRAIRLRDSMLVSDIARTIINVSIPSLTYLSHTLLFVLCLGFLENRHDVKKPLTLGLLAGVCFASLYLIAQWLLWPLLNLSNQTPLWTSINRVSGLASDPNAAGVFIALSLWLAAIAVKQGILALRPRSFALLPVLITAGIITGSRSFLLSLFLLISTYAILRSKRLLISAAVALVFTFTSISLLDRYTTVISTLTDNSHIPEGVKRGVQALSLQRVDDTFFSRATFFTIGSSLIENSPLFGVGAGKFRDYVPLVGRDLKILEGWSDNSNNFYLGLVAELGVFGALAFVASFALRRIRTTQSKGFITCAVVSLALLLLTGPHTDFTEVLIVVATLVAFCTESRKIRMRLLSSSAFVFLTLGAYGAFTRELGSYGWEAHHGGELTRWLAPKAIVSLPCTEAPASTSSSSTIRLASIRLRSPYVPQEAPMQVTFRASHLAPITALISSNAAQTFSFTCNDGQETLLVAITTTPLWAPYRIWPATSHDRRVFGIQQIR